ncbi:MAG: tRNA (adenine-N1)-methyltransferase [Chloroflexi bacterium]|nr:MAG: tRNA (adenine-N1)-methyltransferase [Chloroflexota bacterium]
MEQTTKDGHELPEKPASVWFRSKSEQAAPGDLALLLTTDLKRYVVLLQPGRELHTHLGIFGYEGLVGQRWGGAVQSSLGHEALLLEPSLDDLIRHLRRGTQIIYPKDAAYIVHRLNLRAGCRVIEAGTGSGGLTTALAWAVAPSGVVYSYETRLETHRLAYKNLESVGLLPYVQLLHGDIKEGFQQTGVDALFLDVRTPWAYLDHVLAALRPAGFFAALLPTTNQVCELLAALDTRGFVDIAVEELLLRTYKPVPDRLRPDDMMNAHTGFLLFARACDSTLDTSRWQAKERQRYRARVQTQSEITAEEARRASDRAQGGKKYPELPLPG